jgi:hypothetical protein
VSYANGRISTIYQYDSDGDNTALAWISRSEGMHRDAEQVELALPELAEITGRTMTPEPLIVSRILAEVQIMLAPGQRHIVTLKARMDPHGSYLLPHATTQHEQSTQPRS